MKLKVTIFTFLTGLMTKGVLGYISSKPFETAFLFEVTSPIFHFISVGHFPPHDHFSTDFTFCLETDKAAKRGHGGPGPTNPWPQAK